MKGALWKIVVEKLLWGRETALEEGGMERLHILEESEVCMRQEHE